MKRFFLFALAATLTVANLYAAGCVPSSFYWTDSYPNNYTDRFAFDDFGTWQASGLRVGNNRAEMWLTADVKPDKNSVISHGEIYSPLIKGGIGELTISFSAPDGYAAMDVYVYKSADNVLFAQRVMSSTVLTVNVAEDVYLALQNSYSNYGSEAPRIKLLSACWTSYSTQEEGDPEEGDPEEGDPEEAVSQSDAVRPAATKVLHDGQILIRRGESLHTLTGAKVL